MMKDKLKAFAAGVGSRVLAFVDAHPRVATVGAFVLGFGLAF